MESSSHDEQTPVVRMVAMQGSSGTESYALNSSGQNHNFHAIAKPRLAIALKHVIRNIVRTRKASIAVGTQHDRPCIAIADLGCSHGRNTLDYAEFVLQTLQQSLFSCEEGAIDVKKWHGTEKEDDILEMRNLHKDASEMEIQYFFSDLPSNDFNALFKSLQPYLYQGSGVCSSKGDRALPKIFAAGVPGSFYGRLFPSESLDLVICAYSLHWLSQVPPSVFDRTSPSWNGDRMWINKASASVEQAYAEQSNLDIKGFLKCRMQELAHGGVMFLFISARSSDDDQDCLSSHHNIVSNRVTFELLNFAFQRMVDEGLLSMEEMEMFNMPTYFFNQQELENALSDFPELCVLHMETVENMPFFQEQKNRMHTVQQYSQMSSSGIGPLLEAQFGKCKADEILKRRNEFAFKLDCFDKTMTHNLVIACLQRHI